MEKAILGEADTTLTQRFSLPGMIMGTVSYMSPEQARGTDVDGRSDIFTLGIVMYEMLTGQPPFRGETATDVIAELIQTDPPPPSTLNRHVPAELDEIVERAVAKDPTQRFQGAEELLDRLKKLLRRLEFDTELRRTVISDPGKKSSARISGVQISEIAGAQVDSYLPDLTPLIGRESELGQLTDLIVNQRKRLVTLTGIGGTGKTRLAQELCRRVADEFRDGFVLVRLAEIRDAALVPTVIAQQLRVQEIVGLPLAESLKDSLREKQTLLVLDNFEQIIDAAPLVADLLANTRELSIVVTSRERLRLQAETEFNVPPLPVPQEDEPVNSKKLAKIDSVRLFVQRSRQATPDFRLTEENAGQIAKICSMLDGLPLAIELAAARTRVFSPATIVEKLEARLAFLTGGAIDLPKRQQTMRAAVEWSYELLNEEEKRLFRRLSVFACRFTAVAAEAVASRRINGGKKDGPTSVNAALDSVEFLDIFASLADKSLLVRRRHPGSEITYGLIEIVREYAQAKLETDDDSEEIRRRHARYYLAIAKEAESFLQTKDTGMWIRTLDEEYENIRLVLLWSIEKEPYLAARLAAAIRHFWLIRGHLSEGLAWSEAILALNLDIPAETKWKILTACGNISQFQGDIKKAHTFYDEALTAARQTRDQKSIAQSLRGVGALAYLQHDFFTARNLINEAIKLSRDIGDDFGLAAALARLGDISNVEGDPSAARELTAESLAIFRRIGYSEGVSAKLYNLGAIVFLDGDHELARQHFEEAHTAAMELGEKINTRLIFDGFAALAVERGDYVRAAKLSGVADSIGATIGYTIEPAEQLFRDTYLGKLKDAMPREEFETEHEAGRNLSTEEARKLAYIPTENEGRDTAVEVPHTSVQNAFESADIQAPGGPLYKSERRSKVLYAILLLTLVIGGVVFAVFWISGRT
jgi:predicted ATPase